MSNKWFSKNAIMLVMLGLVTASCSNTAVSPVPIDPTLLTPPTGPGPAPKTRSETEDLALATAQKLKACIMQINTIRDDLAIRNQIQYGTEPGN